MSGFDLPPVVGYDRQFRLHPLLGEKVSERQNPEVSATSVDGPDASGRTSESVFARSLDAVQSMQDDVSEKYKGLVLGEDVELHDIMVAASKSEVAFNLMLEVRNKLVEAWEKLSRSAV